MKILACLAGIYMLCFGTYVVRLEMKRQAEQDTELHDYRAAQFQLRLLELQMSQPKGIKYDL